MNKKKNAQLAIAITVITITCKMLGFIKNSILAYYFGISPVVDAYVMTFSIGTITCGWIAGLVGNFTPVFKKVVAEHGRNQALDYARNVHNFIWILVVLLVVVLELIAPSVVHIVAPGFSGITYEYTVWFFRLYLISVIFYATFRFLQEFLNCNREHIWAAGSDVIMSACCIVAIIVSSKIGNSFLIYGYVIAIILECLIVEIGSHRIGFQHYVGLCWDKNLKSLIIMAIPIFLSNTLAEINTLIDKIFASKLESGIVASLDYANTMKDFAFQIGTIAMVTMIFPVLSEHWVNGEIEHFKDKVINGISILVILYTPMISGIIVSGDLIINIVFKRGMFSEEAATITSNAFIIYSIALIALTLRSVFLKAFYSMQKTKYILFVSLVNVVLNIILNTLLVKWLGYIGLALATCLSALLCLPMYFVMLKKSIPTVKFKLFYVKFGKAVFSSGIMYGILKGIRSFFFNRCDYSLLAQLVMFCFIVVIGIISYVLIGYVLNIQEIREFVKYAKKKMIRS